MNSVNADGGTDSKTRAVTKMTRGRQSLVSVGEEITMRVCMIVKIASQGDYFW